MLSKETLHRYAEVCTPDTETGALNYVAFARAIEAEARKQDTELIRQMKEALENPDALDEWNRSKTDGAITAARARLGETT